MRLYDNNYDYYEEFGSLNTDYSDDSYTYDEKSSNYQNLKEFLVREIAEQRNKSERNLTLTLSRLIIWQDVLWVLLFGSIIIISVAGNGIIIWLSLWNKEMRSAFHCLIANLCAANILLALLNAPYHARNAFEAGWEFGEVLCKFSQASIVIALIVIVFTLLVISVERHIAIELPILPDTLPSKAVLKICIAIWLLAFFVSAPILIYAKSTEQRILENREYENVCYINWQSVYFATAYGITFFLVTWLIPIFWLIGAYARARINIKCYLEFWSSSKPEMEKLEFAYQGIKMMIRVSIIFALFWMPLQFLPYITIFWNLPYSLNVIYLIFYWLALGSSMLYPIIFCCMDKSYAKELGTLFFDCGDD